MMARDLRTKISCALILTALFTALVIRWSFEYGRLSQDPTYDDVTYFRGCPKSERIWVEA